MWDVETGAEKWHNTERHDVSFMQFAPNGRYVALGQTLPTVVKSGTIVLGDVNERMEVGEFRGHERGVTGLAFSPDGKYLLSSSLDGTVRLWDVATQSELAVFDGHADASLCVGFSSDGRLAASGGQDGTLRIWDISGALPNDSLQSGADQRAASGGLPGRSTLMIPECDATMPALRQRMVASFGTNPASMLERKTRSGCSNRRL